MVTDNLGMVVLHKETFLQPSTTALSLHGNRSLQEHTTRAALPQMVGDSAGVSPFECTV